MRQTTVRPCDARPCPALIAILSFSAPESRERLTSALHAILPVATDTDDGRTISSRSALRPANFTQTAAAAIATSAATATGRARAAHELEVVKPARVQLVPLLVQRRARVQT